MNSKCLLRMPGMAAYARISVFAKSRCVIDPKSSRLVSNKRVLRTNPVKHAGLALCIYDHLSFCTSVCHLPT